MRSQGHSGFTMFEISIVLVIIGLLVGSIVIGRDMIRSAELRGQISQIEKMDSAVSTFRLAYDCLPGDCGNAVPLGLGIAGGDGDNGNGNGSIESGADIFAGAAPNTPSEAGQFWYHLSAANLLNGTYRPAVPGTPGVNSPPLVMGGAANTSYFFSRYQFGRGGIWLGIQKPDGAPFPYPVKLNAWFLTAGEWFSDANGVYFPIDAYMLDTKIDDGFPLSGKMTAIGLTGCSSCNTVNHTCNCYNAMKTSDPGIGADKSCVDDGTSGSPVRPAQYNTRITDRSAARNLCTPVIRSVF